MIPFLLTVAVLVLVFYLILKRKPRRNSHGETGVDAGSSYTLSSDASSTSVFSGNGGEFSGAGASSSWGDSGSSGSDSGGGGDGGGGGGD